MKASSAIGLVIGCLGIALGATMEGSQVMAVLNPSAMLIVLVGTLGKQYSLAEFRDILENAGFTDVSAQRTGGGYYSLVSARKP